MPEASVLQNLGAGEEIHPGWELWAGASVSWDSLPRCKHIWSPSGRDLEHQDSQYTSDWGCEGLKMSQAFPPTPISLPAISSPLLGRITNPRQEVRASEGAGSKNCTQTQTDGFISFSYTEMTTSLIWKESGCVCVSVRVCLCVYVYSIGMPFVLNKIINLPW